MKTTLRSFQTITIRASLLLIASGLLAGTPARAAATWTGGGADGNWQTPGNWGGSPPSAGDALVFQGNVRISNTNNFTVNTVFNGITFNSPAAAFNLYGAQISLTNDIADNQVVVNESVNLPLALDATHNLNVISNGVLTIGNVISGVAGAGVTLPNGGQVRLTATNTITGPVTINGGILTVFSDFNLGATNAGPTPGKLVINGGTLQTTNTFTMNANRGIALGPTSGSGTGTFDVNFGGGTFVQTLTYRGVIANNGAGVGGLTKIGFGGLTLSGANTYTGPTAVKNGTMTLDFTQTNPGVASPINNIIKPNSSLTLGGATSGRGVTNFAGLITIPLGSSVTNSQTFNNTFIDLGQTFVRALSNNLGTANINLGLLTHTNGGVVNIILPTLQGGNGTITTTATNVNGILGGWVTIGDGHVDGGRLPYAATNWASVDANGNIVNFANYALYSSGNLSALANPTNNVFIPGSISGDVVLDTDGAGTTNDFNTISMNRNVGWTLIVGANNVLRLGKTGAIFNQLNNAGITWGIGGGTGGLAGPQAGAGIITAGGPTTDTPGELVVINNTTGSASAQNMSLDSQIMDNGTGVVTLVKAGPGFLKLRNHNSYSGGTYILQGRIQLDNSLTGGTPIPDAFGTGPVYIFPGGNIFFSGTSPGALPNEFFVAGASTEQEPGIGCIRTTSGWAITNTVHLIGDTTIGGNGGVAGGILGKITGSFALSLGSAGTVNSTGAGVSISNPSNDWTGDTTIQARTLNNSSANFFTSGGSEVIPNGFGKGNVIMSAGTIATIAWNLNNFTETINGLSAINPQNCSITTGGNLIVGDNDQSGTFGGTIQDAISLTKIGGGTETLTGTASYSGATTVSGGTLAVVSLSGALSGSAIQVNPNAVLDVSAVTGGNIGSGSGIGINGGSLFTSISGSTSVSGLALTNAHLKVTLNPVTINIQDAGSLTADGATNLLDISSIQNVSAYPVQFTVIKYSGAIQGAGFNFGLGALPTGTTTGFVSNNVANSSVDVVLFNGPKLLNWTGSVNTNWDIVGTANWKFGAATVVYNDQDSPVFDDTASRGLVNLTTMVTPSLVTVSNNSLSYVFAGPGNITGFAGLIKQGPGSLTITNAGVDNYSGGVTVNGGMVTFGVSNNISGGIAINGATVQLTAGNLPSGTIVNEGTLLLNGTGDLVVNNAIAGDSNGAIIKTNTGSVTLGGASTFNATTTIGQGTIKAGSAGAFGTGGTVIVTNSLATTATLDVNGQALQASTTVGPATIMVNGAGVGGNGVIVNNGADNLNALLNVTLAGDTTFGGGIGRWDIRGTGAQLLTGGQPFNLTKVGTNQVSLVNVAVDGSLSNILVQQGMLGIETGTSGNLGETTTSTLTVAAGAALELFANTQPLSKPLVLNGDGVNNTVLNNSGATHINAQVIRLNSGNCVFNIGGTSLSLDDNGGGNTLNGTGGLTKSGGSLLYLNIPQTYSGPTIVSNGVLIIDAPELNSSSITVGGGVLSGTSWFTSPITVGPNGTLSPGDTNLANPSVITLVISNSLSLGGTCELDLAKNGGQMSGDVITNVTALTYGGQLKLDITVDDPINDAITNGDSIRFFGFNTASGAFTSINPSTPGPGLAWDTSQLTTSGTLRVKLAPTAPPVISGIKLSAGNIIISGTNGVPNQNYMVLATTNVAAPLLQWTPIATNSYDGNGNFSFTNAVNPNAPRQFYILSQ